MCSLNPASCRAQVKGIPFIMFDVGGVVEMVDYKMHGDVVVAEPSMPALRDKLTGAGRPRCPAASARRSSGLAGGAERRDRRAQTCCTRARSRRCS